MDLIRAMLLVIVAIPLISVPVPVTRRRFMASAFVPQLPDTHRA